MERKLKTPIQADLETKIVLVSGPRQVGKTTLSKTLFKNFEYLNYDSEVHRKIIKNETWDRNQALVVFDELHKMPKWKSWIKGVFDTQKIPPRLLVTGSARMDILRRGGDSLAGRHRMFRLHPFSVAELKGQMDPNEVLKRLLQFGGFPEPFLANSPVEAKRFRISHLDKILRGDLLDLAQVRDLRKIELLVDILAERVGSSISYSNLAQDLEVSPHTVKSWISILESLYIVFVVTPYSQKISRAISKEPKIYFFDTGRIHDSPGARLENVVACALLKDIHFHEDVLGDTGSLHYLRTRTGQEVDFLVVRNKKPHALIEVKVSDAAVSPSLFYFNNLLKAGRVIQVVQNLNRGYLGQDHELIRAVDYLSSLEQF